MLILPKLRAKFGENVGTELFISHPDLDGAVTSLSNNISATSSTLSVDNGLPFASYTGEYILVGKFDTIKAEILRISSGTAPTQPTITLNGSSAMAHNRGETVTYIPYNQIVIESSSDNVTFSTLATINIQPNQKETWYKHGAGTSGTYYRVKFSNSATSTVSSISDSVLATGFVTPNSIGSIIRSALIGLGEKIDNVITKEFLYEALNEGRYELDNHPDTTKWSFRTAFDYNAGQVIPGRNYVTLPTNILNSDTQQSILSVRIGKNKWKLRYVDKTSLNRWYMGTALSTIASTLTAGDSTITLTASGDFDNSGNVYISATNVSGTLDIAAYTANDESTNVLSGVTGVADNKAVGIQVWQHINFGTPVEYTVYEDKIVFNCPFSDILAGEVIWLDYYSKLTEINSDSDLLDEPDPKAFINYLKYRIKDRRNKGFQRDTDSDYKDWEKRRDSMIRKNYLGQDIRFKPNVPC